MANIAGKLFECFKKPSNVFEGGRFIASRMQPVNTLPPARLENDYRSRLLLVGSLGKDGKLTVHPDFVYYKVFSGEWCYDATDLPVEVDFTHWIYAEDQEFFSPMIK